MNAIIETHELTKSYRTPSGEIRAVDGLTLSVDDGEIFCLLGPNGAGKTTTIGLLLTLLRPTAGYARVAGFDTVRQSIDVRRRVGYASQEVIADELLTGRENLSLIAQLAGLPRDGRSRRVQHQLDRFGLAQWADRQVKTYSGGMRKKLDLAGALIQEPKLLFLDEPTLGLDPQTRRVVWDDLLDRNRDHGVTLFMTTHYLEEADALAHRVAIIDRGRLLALGTPAALKRALGEAATLDDVYRSFTGGSIREGSAAAPHTARATA